MRTNHGRSDAATVRVSASEKAVPDSPAPDARFWAATPDGLEVLFTTQESLLDGGGTSGGTKLYKYSVVPDAQGHHLTFISVDSEPGDGTGGDVDGVVGMSADASYVYFIARGQLEANKPTTDAHRLYVWHDGVVREVADVSSDVDANLGKAGWILTPQFGRVSADGKSVLFMARGDGATSELPHSGAGDTCLAPGGCREVYVYSAAENGGAGALACASCQPGQPDAPSHSDADVFAQDQVPGSAILNHPLSNDGRFVFFTSREKLVSADENDATDVYEYDTRTSTTQLLSSGAAESLGAQFVDAGASGGDVFFTTRDRLVGWDVDDNLDMYDARIGGGFAEPKRELSCSTALGCRGTSTAFPQFRVPASTTFSGVGNVKTMRRKAVRRCHKARVHKRVHGHVRCVKPKRRATPRTSGTAIRKGR